ncbi:fatty acid-binding protein, muscle-like [Achroia grisella]|uniref:fatty acid-binding protein, muscle-like n=1 Tax=Achroia grisella TaxID=688607 RepID=UPI0027D331A4|nr:fatty acid-binding protein, muscle-like [Achroia grisella]
MEQYFGKKYKLKTSENFDEFMKALGIGFISRKTAASLSPVCELTKNDDGTYIYSFSTPIRTLKYVFKLGEEVITERADGAKMKSTFTIEGNSVIHIEVDDNGKASKHVRTFSDDKLVVISTLQGWDGECTRIYELVN